MCASVCLCVSNQTLVIIYIMPVIPTLLSVHRLSGSSATVNWIPLTQGTDSTSFEVAYEPALDSTQDCSSLEFMDSETVFVREHPFEQGSAEHLWTGAKS